MYFMFETQIVELMQEHLTTDAVVIASGTALQGTHLYHVTAYVAVIRLALPYTVHILETAILGLQLCVCISQRCLHTCSIGAVNVRMFMCSA
jgi:hypothetical protein